MAKTLYIYQGLSEVSTNYHSEGSAVIVTDRNPQECWCEHFKGVGLENEKLPEADFVYNLADDAKEQVFIFPDAGCC